MKRLYGANTIWHVVLFLLCVVGLLSSCSNNSYVNAIPSNATGIIKINATKIEGGNAAAKTLAMFLPIEDIEDCGIDWSSNVFAFETIDGNFGVCAKVKSGGKLGDALSDLVAKGKCGNIRKQGDFTFAEINNAWAIGFSDDALVVLGPVSAAALADTQRTIAKLLRQDEESGIQSQPIFAKLDSMESNVAMVAKIQALPEKFAAPFCIGAPKDADASQVLVAVDFDKVGGIVKMCGETFSFNKSIDDALKKANSTYRKIDGDYLDKVPQNGCLGWFANVDGKQFLPLLQSNKSLQALLAGLNTAIDFDNIIRSVDGDLMFMSTGVYSEKNEMAMYAKVGHADWVADVDYWKQSCTAGSSITGADGNWCYNSGNMHFAFGLKDNMFYGTTNSEIFPVAGKATSHSLSSDIQDVIKGNRMVMLLNISGMQLGEESNMGIGSMVKAMLGDVKAVAYVMK